MDKIIKLSKDHKELIWGTEDWVVSGHGNGQSRVNGGSYDNMLVSELIQAHPEVFNHQVVEQLPLLIKVIDTHDDLSVQVHPGDEYAKKHENSLGKTECWYILDAASDSDIIVGHSAPDKQTMQTKINDQALIDCLNVMPIKKGDFFNIPSGTVHAIRKNTTILEVQQSSDITYRLFDYNRVQADGSLRELHINKALDVIDFEQENADHKPVVKELDDLVATALIKSEFFDVFKFDIINPSVINNDFDYVLGVAIEEGVVINGEALAMHEGFIIPHNVDLEVSGSGSFVITTVVRR